MGRAEQDLKRLLNRLSNSKHIYAEAMTFTRKREALELIKTFQDGIKKNNFGLTKLKDATIKRKENQGLQAPNRPLYGYGPQKDKSYMNMLKIQKLKNGWKVYPSRARHHTSQLKLSDLLIVHEYGTTITRKTGKPIRIPPRPAFRKAKERVLNKIKKSTHDKDVRKAINEFIKNGKKTELKKIISRARSAEKKLRYNPENE